MVGIPHENLARALNTVKLTAQIRPDSVQTSIYYPYPKTKLYEISYQQGYLTDKTLESYFESDTVLQLPDFTKKDIIFSCRNFNKTVEYYKRAFGISRPWRGVLEKILDFLWLHPRIFNTIEPIYHSLKKGLKFVRGHIPKVKS